MIIIFRKKVAAVVSASILLLMLCSCKPTEQSDPSKSTSTSKYTEYNTSSLTSSSLNSTSVDTTTQSSLSSTESAPISYDEPITLDAAAIMDYSVGRTLLSDGVMYMNHSCSGFRFNFRGTSIKAEFLSSDEYCYDTIHQAWIAVYLNDNTEPYRRFPLNSNQAEYTLFESEEPIDARITVVKLTEQQFGTAGIKTLQLSANSSIAKIPDNIKYIEFFGDSITAGYGNEGELSHGFDTSEENGYLTYAPITARALGADYSLICVSGMGLTESRTCDLVASDIYPKTDAFISDKDYSFTRQPQIVVVNLGANDSYYINLDGSYYELYESKYYELLKDIRAKNPNAVIICCICDFWQARMPQIERAVEKFSKENGDGKIYSLLLPYVTKDADYGSDAHPKIKVQYEIAEVLTTKIKELGIFG